MRFLDLVMLAGVNSDRPMPSYDVELVALHDLISQAVSVLLADSVNSVKQCLMEASVTKLAVFFGKQKANDVLLSHMITFLNDKEDAQLRLSFYENIIGVAAFVGTTTILFIGLFQAISVALTFCFKVGNAPRSCCRCFSRACRIPKNL